MLRSIEICAGAGGQALGLEMAGFEHLALVENDKWPCETLRMNRPKWNVIEGDVRNFSAEEFEDIDLFAGGVPCPPFSIGGKQLGAEDERDLFPEALRLVEECDPKAVMLENVRGLLSNKFDDYRFGISLKLEKLGYVSDWKLLNASDFGVPQLRPRVILVAIKEELAGSFSWPEKLSDASPTVGETLHDLMAVNGWKKINDWIGLADKIAPTVVGGSKKHGGPDLGPTRAKRAWAELGVNGKLIGNEAPLEDFDGMPLLTVRMVARIQGFPDEWKFSGKKTASYRQVGNAFPPPVANAVGFQIRECLENPEVWEDDSKVLELKKWSSQLMFQETLF
jgi:DNA (cytosine-5)-methyltransferase 1